MCKCTGLQVWVNSSLMDSTLIHKAQARAHAGFMLVQAWQLPRDSDLISCLHMSCTITIQLTRDPRLLTLAITHQGAVIEPYLQSHCFQQKKALGRLLHLTSPSKAQAHGGKKSASPCVSQGNGSLLYSLTGSSNVDKVLYVGVHLRLLYGVGTTVQHQCRQHLHTKAVFASCSDTHLNYEGEQILLE